MQFWVTVALTGWAVIGPFVGGGIAEVRSRLIDISNARAAAAREAASDEHERCSRRGHSPADCCGQRGTPQPHGGCGPTPAEKTALQSVCNASTGACANVLLNDSLFFGIGHARSSIAARVADYNTARPHSSLGYATPADFARTIVATGPDAVPDDSSALVPVLTTYDTD